MQIIVEPLFAGGCNMAVEEVVPGTVCAHGPVPRLERAPGHRVPGSGHRRACPSPRSGSGWRLEIAEPMPDKCVIIMYPHTSNWIFPIGLLN